MSLLMGAGVKRDFQNGCHGLSLGLSRQKAGHIGPFYLPGPGTCPDGRKDARQICRFQIFQNGGQTFHMLEQRLTLPKAKGPLGYFQQLSGVVPPGSIKPSSGCGIVAGIQSQYTGHIQASFGSEVALGRPCSGNSARTKAPKIPLMNETTFSSSYFLAISTASLMAAAAGISGI